MNDKELSLTYITGAYPGLTTTFIDREIVILRQMGVKLRIVSIRRPWTRLSAEQKQLAEGVTYLMPINWLTLFAALVWFALLRTSRYYGTLFYLLSRPHVSLKMRLMTLLHFIEGVYAAYLLRSDPGNHLHAHFIDRTATVALVVSRLLNIPYSVTAHASDIYVSPVLLKEKLAGAKFVVTCTKYNRAYLSNVGGKAFDHKLLCIYHGLDIRRYRRNAVQANSKPIILSVGQLKERKGLPYLIEACRVLKEQGIDFECRIVGEGPLWNELKAQIDRWELADCVHLLGALPHEEVIAQYDQATIFTLPAVQGADGDRDGIPNVILEALAMELPVVATDHSGVPEVIEDAVTGLLVPPKDVDALAAALARLIRAPELRKQFGKAGRRIVMEHFDPETNAQQLCEAFANDARPQAENRRKEDALILVWSTPTHGSSRSRLLAKELGIDGPYYIWLGLKRGGLTAPLRYIVQAWKTLWLLFQKRPRMVIVQSPPSFAVMFTALYCALTGARYIVDAHSDALQSDVWMRPRWLYLLLARRAAVTLVTDEYYRQMLAGLGAKAMVVRDPVTRYPQDPYELDGHFNVTVVNTFANDEPLGEILRAADDLPEVQFYITGKIKNGNKSLLTLAPNNVEFTDFLPERQYYGLLKSSDAVMTLTTRDHTLQCGACESLSLERPIITSDWPLLREYFCLGTVHVTNTAESIRQGIKDMQQDYQCYQGEIAQLRQLRLQEWQQCVAALVHLIQQ